MKMTLKKPRTVAPGTSDRFGLQECLSVAGLMSVRGLLPALLVLVCGFSQARAQSLGDVARAAREKRAKVVQEMPVRSWTNDDIPKAPTSGGPTVATGISTGKADAPSPKPESSAIPPEAPIPPADLDANPKAQPGDKPQEASKDLPEASAENPPQVAEERPIPRETPPISEPVPQIPAQSESAIKTEAAATEPDSTPLAEFGNVQAEDSSANAPGQEKLVAGVSQPTAEAADAAPAEPVPAEKAATVAAVHPAAEPPRVAPSGNAPWIWQGSDQDPVHIPPAHPQRVSFDPQRAMIATETGFGLRVNGNANLGYASQTQNAAPSYNDFNGGVSLNTTGFIYSPRLVNFTLWGSYDRRDTGFGDRDSAGNGFNYGGTVSLLQATPVPFSVSLMRATDRSGGSLSMPFSFDGRSMEVNGLVQRLPVKISYHLGTGSNGTVTADGHDFAYRYKNASIALSRKWAGFDIHVTDDYLLSRSNQTFFDTSGGSSPLDLTNTGQTNNNLRWNVDRTLGAKVTMYAGGILSKYRFEGINSQTTDANLSSIAAGLRWTITPNLDAVFSGTVSRNAVNILQLLSQGTGAPFPNPLPGVTALDTTNRVLGSTLSYRPSGHWRFGATGNYNAVTLPPALSVPTSTGIPGLTNRILSGEGSAAYERRLGKFDYTGVFSGGLQSYSYASGDSGLARIYNVSNSVARGDERTLRYGVRFTVDRTDNPVFFSLLNTRDRLLDIDFTRQERSVRLVARIGYSQREIDYAGSAQRLHGLNFLFSASLSNLSVTASHYASDMNQQFFNLINPLGNGTGITPLPPGLLNPLVFSSTSSDSVSASWRIRPKLQLESRYSRFGFTVTGNNEQNQETWFDNSVQYHLGRFDIIGGFIHATGNTATWERRTNRFYIRTRFPFQIW